jgi:hypothetical protein
MCISLRGEAAVIAVDDAPSVLVGKVELNGKSYKKSLSIQIPNCWLATFLRSERWARAVIAKRRRFVRQPMPLPDMGTGARLPPNSWSGSHEQEH